MVIRVILIEADDGLRKVHTAILGSASGFDLITSATSFAQALDRLELVTESDVFVINISSDPEARAREWSAIRFLFPHVAILALASELEDYCLLQALRAGVTNFSPASLRVHDFVLAIKKAHQGIRSYDDTVARRIGSLLTSELRAQVRFGCLELDLGSGHSQFRGQELRLSRYELRILAYLVCHRGRIIGPDELLERIWGVSPQQGGTSDQLKSCIKRIRRKMENGSMCPRYIQCRRAFGYFVPDTLEQPCQECAVRLSRMHAESPPKSLAVLMGNRLRLC